VTELAARMKRLVPAGVTALALGVAALMTAAPAQAQYGYRDGYRPRVERHIIERRVGRPVVERRIIVRRPVVRDCRVVVTRRINHFGERVVVRRRICR
jgi:hypothetical protein